MLIAITRKDGGLSIMNRLDEGDDATIDAEIAKAEIDASSWRILSGPEELPEDRTYRNAWEDDGKAIIVDPVKAAAIDLKNAALERDPFAEIDALKAEIAALKAAG